MDRLSAAWSDSCQPGEVGRMIASCVLGAHTFRFACQDAHGSPAGALIAVPEGRSAQEGMRDA
jgi:hypothetical protein